MSGCLGGRVKNLTIKQFNNLAISYISAGRPSTTPSMTWLRSGRSSDLFFCAIIL